MRSLRRRIVQMWVIVLVATLAASLVPPRPWVFLAFLAGEVVGMIAVGRLITGDDD